MTVAPDWALAIPTPGIHNPPGGGGPLPTPIPLQQLGATMQFFLDVFIGKIAIAFGGIEILGWHPFQFLADWGQARIDQANANYLLAATADGKAQDALDFIAQMVDGILGTGHTVGDFVDWLQDTSANAATSISQWNSVISGLAVGDFSGLLAFFEGIPTDIAAAAADGAAALDKLVHVSVAGIYDAAAGFGNLATSLLKNLTPTGGNIGQFDAAGLAGALGGALTFGGTALSTFFGNINSSGGLLASGLTGAFNGAVTLGGNSFTNLLQYLNSSGQFAAGQLTGAINGGLTLGGVTLSTLVTNINSSGQILAAGITGALGTTLTVGGVQLGTLFTNINSSGQILGAGITGAINTAATVAGTAIGTVATNANAAVTNINSLISGVSGSVIADVTNVINTANTNAQGVINAVNNAAAGVTSGASSLLSVAATNLSALLGSAPTNLLGTTGVYGQAATDSAYAAVAAAAAAQAAEQTRINSAFNAVFNVSPATAGNVSQTIDFTSMANQTGMSGIMLPGTGSGNGYLGVTSGQAMWQGGTSALNSVGDLEVFPTTTTSDYQVVTVTLGSLNDSPTSNKVEGYVLARCNSARDTFLMLRIYTNGSNIVVSLHCMVSGTFTTFSGAAAIVATAAPGGSLRWVIGDPTSASEYALQVLYNGTPVITYTDSSHISQKGSSYRYVGLGAFVSSVGGAGKFPAGIRTVTYQDNPPAPSSYPFSGTPTAGTKGRMYVSNDVGLIQRDNGTAWEYIWGGPLGYFTKPPSTSWSWVNQGTATTATELGGERITAPSGTRNWRLRVRTLTPSSNYSVRCYVETAGRPADSWFTGLILRDTGTQSFISFGVGLVSSPAGYNAHLGVNRWASATTFNAESWHQTAYLLPGGCIPQWLGISDDGTNRYFQFSHNGIDWITAYSESRTAYITPNQFGFGASNEGSGADVIMRLRSLTGIS